MRGRSCGRRKSRGSTLTRRGLKPFRHSASPAIGILAVDAPLQRGAGGIAMLRQ